MYKHRYLFMWFKLLNMKAFLVTTILMCLFLVPLNVFAQPYFNENQTWQANLTNVTYPSIALGDVDKDGDLDLALSGCSDISFQYYCATPVSKIYINNGTTFIEDNTWQQNLTQIHRGSIAWADIDKDGDLDLVAGGCSSGGGYSTDCDAYSMKIYINIGTTLIENSTWQQNLENTNFYSGSIAFGDVDKDGDLDLALVGASQSENNGIYINTGTTFSKSSVWIDNIPYMGQKMGGASVAWGNLNNDNNLDLIVMGSASTNFYSYIYINNGTSLVRNSSWEQNLGSALGFPSLALGGYRNNEKSDMVYIGARAGDHIKFFNNTGNTFVLSQENLGSNDLVGILDGAVAWGDYDNDGDLDLAANGRETYTDIYTNHNGIFDRNTTIGNSLIDLRFSSLAWSDINNDGDLDLIESGDNGNSFYTLVYTSNFSLTKENTLPNSPNSNFNSTFNFSTGELKLSWAEGSDTETPILGLYYNLRVGTCLGCHDVVSGVFGGSSNPTAGYFGNMIQRKSITLNQPDLENQTIYWAVQTIDAGLAKSAWSEEQVFEIIQVSPPCYENWTYGEWSSCVNGQQSRSATDLNNCGTEVNKSETTRNCSTPPPPNGGSSGPLGSATPPEEKNESIVNKTDGTEPEEDNKSVSDKNESVAPQICIPMERRCLGNDLLECSVDGMEWVKKEVCEYGCENGKCKERPTEFGGVLGYLWPIVIVVIIIIIILAGIVLYRKHSVSIGSSLS